MAETSNFVRTAFGISAAALSASWYGEGVFESEKAKKLEEHVAKIAALGPLPTNVHAVLVDRSGPHLDGIEFEWVTEL